MTTGDTLVGIEVEQVVVAGDDERGLSGQGTGEEVIVVGVMLDDARGGGGRDAAASAA